MFGAIEVTLLSEEPLADFVIRTFKIRKPEDKVRVFSWTHIKFYFLNAQNVVYTQFFYKQLVYQKI